ncbi:chemosensory receptor a [Plakobranchus ocellatus]|uniref:Chemosensory receptor a n=1 Tax=Plakobranchus ocellatus TaxID=259542 RepID=A0AAV4C7K6_9GAST|nr:chemosensory receptor a [Plakobranchus ocellatus]
MDSASINFTQSPFSWPYVREFTFLITILTPILAVIVLLGLFANITNIVVFLKAGIKDNVTTLLISLSISDMMFLVLVTPSLYTRVIIYFFPEWSWPFYNRLVDELLYWPSYTFYDFSSYISVGLGVTRCACVAMPLHFKSVFTKARTVKALFVLFILVVSIRVPIMSTYRLVWLKDLHTNLSSLSLAGQNVESINRFNDIVGRTSLPLINFIIMITCVGVIKLKLYQASMAHKYHTAISSSVSGSKQAPEAPDHQGRSAKDLRVIQCVVLICCIFIVCQLPFLIYTIIRLINPQFDLYGRLQYLFFTFGAIGRIFSYLNASGYPTTYELLVLPYCRVKSLRVATLHVTNPVRVIEKKTSALEFPSGHSTFIHYHISHMSQHRASESIWN